jgi:hypothetical protein
MALPSQAITRTAPVPAPAPLEQLKGEDAVTGETAYTGVLPFPLHLRNGLFAADNPVNMVDPSGYESLLSLQIASSIAVSIRAAYEETATEVGNRLFDTLTQVLAGRTIDEISAELLAQWEPLFTPPANFIESLESFLTENAVIVDTWGHAERLPAGWRPTIGSENAYSVAFQTDIASHSYPAKYPGTQFKAANKALLEYMDKNPDFAATVETLIPDVRKQLIGRKGGISHKPPKGWTWHHHPNTGIMQLVPPVQHTAPGKLQTLFHRGGVGGWTKWGRIR